MKVNIQSWKNLGEPSWTIEFIYGSRSKELTFLADMSAKARSPPPLCLNGHIMNKKRERPETDDFVINKYLVVK